MISCRSNRFRDNNTGSVTGLKDSFLVYSTSYFTNQCRGYTLRSEIIGIDSDSLTFKELPKFLMNTKKINFYHIRCCTLDIDLCRNSWNETNHFLGAGYSISRVFILNYIAHASKIMTHNLWVKRTIMTHFLTAQCQSVCHPGGVSAHFKNSHE